VQRRGIVLPVVRRVSTIAVADRIVALAPKGRDQQARARRSHHRNWWKRRTHSMSTMQAHALPRHADRRGSAAQASMVFLCSIFNTTLPTAKTPSLSTSTWGRLYRNHYRNRGAPLAAGK
jgi:hypothetical protein